MFNNSGAILPSVYLSEKSGTVDTRRLYVFGQYHEALRVRGNTSRAVIVPYSRFIYRDTGKFYIMVSKAESPQVIAHSVRQT